jgi:hypothetical protein
MGRKRDAMGGLRESVEAAAVAARNGGLYSAGSACFSMWMTFAGSSP